MGLTIHYTLSLPGGLTRPEVVEKMEAWRRRVKGLPVVSTYREVVSMSHAEWKNAFEKGFRVGEEFVSVDEERFTCVEPDEFCWFVMQPARGSETALFSLGRYAHKPDVWFREWGVKTQYAGNPKNGGAENFLRAHLAVVAALDIARELGFGLEVEDEGGYWENRNPEALLKEVGRWDNIIAGFGDALKDRIGQVQGAIFERPDFERLEAGGSPAVRPVIADPGVLRLVALTRKAA